jgi:hypothetical protein
MANAHRAQLANEHANSLETLLKMLRLDRRWLVDALDQIERDIRAEQERKQKSHDRLAAYRYLQQFNTPELVLFKLQVSSDAELLRFRDRAIEAEKLTDSDYRYAKEETCTRDMADKRVRERMASLMTERLKEFVKAETARQQ